jgi:bacterioferritin-associated ferredoxin
MEPDDLVCVCNRVSLRKLINFMERERPAVPSRLSECLGAGTGCQWCVPYLARLHEQWQNGETPTLPVSRKSYVSRRIKYHKKGRRDEAAERGE